MKKISMVALLAAMALTVSVFAQDNAAKGIDVRFSGDFTLNPAWETGNDWSKPNAGKRENDKGKAFNILYDWNVNLGLDFNENFSMDFRLSNPGGYDGDYLSFMNGSDSRDADGESADPKFANHIPRLPHAYFTWKTGGIFSMQGGLLEVAGKTALDLVAGYESGEGLWSAWYYGWDCEYNASQGGFKFIFDVNDNLGINLTTALVSSENTLDESPLDHNEFRFILDADIEISDMITISPIFTTRSFWRAYEKENNNGDYKPKTSILLSYGVDADFTFSDAVNINAGLALGHIKGRGMDGNSGEDVKNFAFLMKIAPEFTFGINELALGYSLGIGSERIGEGDSEDKYTATFNDLYFTWLFRVNDNIAFGPAANFAFASLKDDYDNKFGTSNTRFGLRFTTNF